jgi:DNA-binding HxlR family transcriptional regulator
MATSKKGKGNGRSAGGAANSANAAWSRLRSIAGRAWAGRLIRTLDEGPARFNRLKEALDGISAKTLSSLLRSYEDHGLVLRRIVSDRPLGVEYSITQKGKELAGILEEVRDWESRWERRTPR